MGLLTRSPAPVSGERVWTPPAYGACRCEGHIEDVLEMRVPLADASGDMAAWALLMSGALATVPLSAEGQFLSDGYTPGLRGPFHWVVTAGDRLLPFVRGTTERLEAALVRQDGVSNAMWLSQTHALAIAGPGLCTNGVQGAIVMALIADSRTA